MDPISAWTAAQITGALVVFARVGTALMFLPGFGDAQVPGRLRLALAVIFSVVLLPVVPVVLPDRPVLLAALIAREALVGLYIGAGARVLFTALHSLGAIISFVSSLSSALAAGNTNYEGTSAISQFLMVAAGALIFLTDSHHLMLRGLVHSYDLLSAAWLPLGDLAGQIVQLAVKSLGTAALLGAPFFVFGVLYNLGLGVANRVMPALPVFFVAGPATIFLGLWLLWMSAEAILRHFADLYAAFFLTLTP